MSYFSIWSDERLAGLSWLSKTPIYDGCLNDDESLCCWPDPFLLCCCYKLELLFFILFDFGLRIVLKYNGKVDLRFFFIQLKCVCTLERSQIGTSGSYLIYIAFLIVSTSFYYKFVESELRIALPNTLKSQLSSPL